MLAAGGTGVLALLAAWVYSAESPASDPPPLLAASETGEDERPLVPEQATPAPKPPDPFKKTVTPFLAAYCDKCHGPDTDNGGLRFDKYRSTADVQADRKTWAKAMQYLELGAMPPPDHDKQPDAKARVNRIIIMNAGAPPRARLRVWSPSPIANSGMSISSAAFTSAI